MTKSKPKTYYGLLLYFAFVSNIHKEILIESKTDVLFMNVPSLRTIMTNYMYLLLHLGTKQQYLLCVKLDLMRWIWWIKICEECHEGVLKNHKTKLGADRLF